MWRNGEMLFYTAIAASISAVAVIACASVSLWAGMACLAGCAGVYAACVVFTLRRYRKIAELSAYLERLLGGAPALDIRDSAEGELSILKNEVYKATVMLTEQADMLRRDKRELANALSDISHQLKTPLTSLGIMVDLLEDGGLPPEKRNEFMASIRVGLTRMEWLVQTLLKLARLDAGAAALKSERVRLSALVEKATESMLIPMEIKEQTHTVCGEDTDILCDLNWTAEALLNIVKNAVENTQAGGHITISYGVNPLYAYVSVRDNGPGIDKMDLPHLFRRFYRGRNANPDGVGIGLAMSLAILRRQNGNIEAANDNGSVFTLKFYVAAVK